MQESELANWIETTLTVTQGRLAGSPFVLAPWQRRFIAGAFAEGVTGAALSVARGNGKTTLTAAFAAAALAGPLAQPRGEIVVCASSFTQARIAYEHVLAFMRDRIEREPNRWRIQDSANRASIECRDTGARLRCIGSDPRRAYGLAPNLILADEPSSWPRPTSEKMRAALDTALGKLPGSRLLAIGTRPADETHWFAKMLSGGADYAQCHAAVPDDPPFAKRTWAKANPSLAWPDLFAAITSEARKAKSDPALLAAFRALRLNLGTSDVVRSHLLAAGTWAGIESEVERGDAGAVWGVDLGGVAAMSAITAYWPSTGRLEALAAFPRVPDLAERERLDGVPDLYTAMKKRGELLTIGNNVVPVGELLTAALERFGGPPSCVVADRWRAGELADGLAEAGIIATLILRGQGFKDGAEDVRGFRSACLTGKVRPSKSLLLRGAMAEATVVSDPSGNEKLSKSTEGGRRRNARDDAAAAAILAVAEGARQTARPALAGFTFDHLPLSGLHGGKGLWICA